MTVDSENAEKGAAILAAAQDGNVNAVLWRAARGGGFGAVDVLLGLALALLFAGIIYDRRDAAMPLATFSIVLVQWSTFRISRQIKAVCSLVAQLRSPAQTV